MGTRILALLAAIAWSVVAVAGQDRSARGSDRALDQARQRALRGAQVWSEPAVPIPHAALGENPTGADTFDEQATVQCRFAPEGVGGSTPKFDCALENGETVKVKYGRDNPEVFSEVAASRLLGVLGFPADRMYIVGRVRCFGCPPDPFAALQCLNDGTPASRCFASLDFGRAQDFEDAVIERPLKGRRIELRKERGWAWDELSKIDPAAGGAPRAHVDALRLMAVFLGHWDNKSKNQRLLCPGVNGAKSGDRQSGRRNPCERPVAMVQDLGDSFGPFKLDLAGWSRTPIWADARGCRVSMRDLPYGGSTFPDIVITEAGRSFLAERLSQLSRAQIRDLFVGARVGRYRGEGGPSAGPDEWVTAFEEKVRAIGDRACQTPA